MIEEDFTISFHNEETEMPIIHHNLKAWIHHLAKLHGYEILELTYIFCSDEYLLAVNNEYLNHDYYTDIITFDNSDEEGKIESDIFISIDRVADNAKGLNVPRGTELLRVMAHGVLHLCGFKDKSDQEASEMRAQEDRCLVLWENEFNN